MQGKGGTPSCSGRGKCSQRHGTRQSFQGGWTLLAPASSGGVRTRPLSWPIATPQPADGWVFWWKYGAASWGTCLPGPSLPLNCDMIWDLVTSLNVSLLIYRQNGHNIHILHNSEDHIRLEMSYFWKPVTLWNCQTLQGHILIIKNNSYQLLSTA